MVDNLFLMRIYNDRLFVWCHADNVVLLNCEIILSMQGQKFDTNNGVKTIGIDFVSLSM